MGKKNKSLDTLRTWKEFEDYAEDHGLPYSYSHGGHHYHENSKGKMAFSTHEKEPSKCLRHKIIKELLRLIIVTLALAIVISVCFLG